MSERIFYSPKRFPFMIPEGPHMPISQPYVSIPPALVIRDNKGDVWTLGFDYDEVAWRGGKWEYDIVRNGLPTGHFGRVIEFYKGQIVIYGQDGRRVFNGRTFV